MEARTPVLLAICAAVVAASGCHRSNSVDKGAFKSAINDYYSARQECVWPSPMKFPAQADASNEDQTKGFDALTDAGMLTRSAGEKKQFLHSKRVNDYDVSDKGRSMWTVDQTQPGYGNFCYGHDSVSTIDTFTPDNNANSYRVTFRYKVGSLPGWAQTTEMQTAFPKIIDDTSGTKMASAVLTKSTNGWQVDNVQNRGGESSLPQ